MDPLAAFIAIGVAVVASVVGPFLLSWLTNRHRREDRAAEAAIRDDERRKDWARQDEVAAKLAAAQERAARASDSARAVLDEVHTLVNSNLTAEMSAHRDETRGRLVLMRELVDLRRLNGHEPSIAALAEIDAQEAKLAEMDAALRDREA